MHHGESHGHHHGKHSYDAKEHKSDVLHVAEYYKELKKHVHH